MTVRDWQNLGVRRAGTKPFPHGDDRAFLLIPAGARGPAFLMLPNFRVIMKYNPAEAYALAIGYLADRLRGGAPFVQDWPRDERVLTLDERLELQQLLARRGFDVGEPDGLLGPRTRVAIRNFQSASGQIPDGFASSDVLTAFKAFAASPVIDWSVCSLSHLARLSPATDNSSSKLIVTGAPWGLVGLMAMDRPWATCSSKPMIVS